MGRYVQDAKKYAKWLKEGRGQGRGRNYKPWLYVYDVPSRGRSHRVFSHTSNRVVHCLSDLELSVFLLLEWKESVIDIREQFPLSLKLTKEIATRIGAKHPAIRGEKMVMTTDFLASIANPNQPLIAIQVKPESELSKERVNEIIALEKAFWEENNVPFEVFTENSLNMVEIENIRWLTPYLEVCSTNEKLIELASYWHQMLRNNREWPLIKLASELDHQRSLPRGTALSELRRLFAARIATFDMHTPFFKISAGDVTFNFSSHIKKWDH
jgi:hypothetical protein